MRPLRDLIFIKQEDAVKETKTQSGIVLLSTDNDRYQIGDQETMLQDLIKKPKTNKGEVIEFGSTCSFVQKGDVVIHKKGAEVSFVDADGVSGVLISEQSVLVKCVGSEFIPHPDYVLVTISKEAREALYNKKIKRDDGTEVLLFIGGDKGKEDADFNSVFVGTGVVSGVGSNIKNVSKGDTALMSYLCDNDESIIVGYDNGDKIIAVKSVTTRHKEKLMSYASRKPVRDNKGKEVYQGGKLQTYSKDRIVFDRDDYDELSSLYGVVSNDTIIPIEPYVFLEHEETKVMKVGSGGIIFEEDEKIITRKVLAVSEESNERIGVSAGNIITGDDYDFFSLQFGDRTVSCVNDIDLLYAIK